mmetsp:Transcript_112972/g.326379  ORF Transcript_112972/g.326379 Transcript_112972/m.326379 type:complete len:346 (-) Transcript_112972:553-1590(-)
MQIRGRRLLHLGRCLGFTERLLCRRLQPLHKCLAGLRRRLRQAPAAARRFLGLRRLRHVGVDKSAVPGADGNLRGARGARMVNGAVLVQPRVGVRVEGAESEWHEALADRQELPPGHPASMVGWAAFDSVATALQRHTGIRVEGVPNGRLPTDGQGPTVGEPVRVAGAGARLEREAFALLLRGRRWRPLGRPLRRAHAGVLLQAMVDGEFDRIADVLRQAFDIRLLDPDDLPIAIEGARPQLDVLQQLFICPDALLLLRDLALFLLDLVSVLLRPALRQLPPHALLLEAEVLSIKLLQGHGAVGLGATTAPLCAAPEAGGRPHAELLDTHPRRAAALRHGILARK